MYIFSITSPSLPGEIEMGDGLCLCLKREEIGNRNKNEGKRDIILILVFLI